MDTMILSVFGLCAAVVLGVSVLQMVRSRGARIAREEDRGRSDQPERTERELERERQTTLVWLCLLAVVVGAAVLAYLLTR